MDKVTHDCFYYTKKLSAASLYECIDWGELSLIFVIDSANITKTCETLISTIVAYHKVWGPAEVPEDRLHYLPMNKSLVALRSINHSNSKTDILLVHNMAYITQPIALA